MLWSMEHSTNYKPTEEQWRILARQARDENDPDKMTALAERIVEAYHKEKAKKNRTAILGHTRD